MFCLMDGAGGILSKGRQVAGMTQTSYTVIRNKSRHLKKSNINKQFKIYKKM